MRMTIGRIVAAGWMVCVASAVVHGQTIFVSPTGAVGGGVSVGDPNLPFSAPSVSGAQLSVWAVLEPDQTLVAESLNLVATTPGVVDLKSVEMINPLLQSLPGNIDEMRWEYINEPAGAGAAMENFSGFQVGNFVDPDIPGKLIIGAGIGPNSQSVDAQYDAGANAWLLATITYDVVGYGSTELFLQIGENGFLASDAFSSDIDVVFGGSGDPPLNADSQRGENSLTPDAIVYNVELPGDVNGDGQINGLDVSPFVDSVLAGPYNPFADMNLDGAVNGLDVDPFVNAVVGGGGTAAAGAAVPEPATTSLFVVAVLMLGGFGRRRGGRYQQ